MKKIFVMLSMMLAFGASADATPAKMLKKMITLPDGTQALAELRGDEFNSWWQTADGGKYMESHEQEGVFVVADMEAKERVAQALRAPIAASRQQRLQRARAAATADGMQRITPGFPHAPYTGDKKGLIILVEFTNQKFKSNHTREYYEAIANTPNFTHEDGYVGSIYDYFHAQSNGQFRLTFDVLGPVQLENNVSYYGANNAYGNDVRPGEMIKEACTAVSNQVNFADYDWDGDGYADQVFVLYAGYGEATGGAATTIWPHEYELTYAIGNPLHFDTGGVDTYACANEIDKVVSPTTGQFTNQVVPSGIGAICHEFSHCLGFADMYDTGGGTQGMTFWDVMAHGTYLGESFRPCNYTGYERWYAGWVEPIEINEPATINAMQSSTDYGTPFIMYNDKDKDEYYILENRQKTGWDTDLYGDGLMITHVDFDYTKWAYNTVNSSSSDHERCTIFKANNRSTVSSYEEFGDQLYPYVKFGTVRNDELTNESAPAASLYNRNTDGTKFMNKPITEIARNGDGTMSFKVLGGNDENVLDNTAPTAINGIYVDTKAQDSRVYSIDGRFLGNDVNALGKGLYIVGGKKVVK